jgi:hypothetical protein
MSSTKYLKRAYLAERLAYQSFKGFIRITAAGVESDTQRTALAWLQRKRSIWAAWCQKCSIAANSMRRMRNASVVPWRR